MSKDQLQSLQNESTGSDNPVKRKRSLSFLLPVGLLLGFVIVFALLFGSRLLPAIEVQTAPVITLRSTETQEATETNNPQPSSFSKQPSSTLLFQASGWVEPDPYVTDVPTLQNGVIDKVLVLEGSTVKKGDQLATLVSDDAKLNLQQAEQKLNSIRSQIAAHCSKGPSLSANLEAGKKRVSAEKARLLELQDTTGRLASLPTGAIPEQDLAQAKLQVDRQKAVLEEVEAEIPRLEAELVTLDYERIAMGNTALEAETDIERAQLALDRTTIIAPMDGIILHLHAIPGKKRMLNMDDPKSATIVELYDPQKLQARIDVPLNEAAQLTIGQSVTLVTDLLTNTEFQGTVTRIVGEADLQRNTLQTKVAIHNPDKRLRPGMLMRAKFTSAGTDNATNAGTSPSASNNRLLLYAPTKALANLAENKATAWVVSGDHAEKRALTLGSENRDGHTQVLDGLRSGEQLILPPHDQLNEGSRVKVSSLKK